MIVGARDGTSKSLVSSILAVPSARLATGPSALIPSPMRSLKLMLGVAVAAELATIIAPQPPPDFGTNTSVNSPALSASTTGSFGSGSTFVKSSFEGSNRASVGVSSSTSTSGSSSASSSASTSASGSEGEIRSGSGSWKHGDVGYPSAQGSQGSSKGSGSGGSQGSQSSHVSSRGSGNEGPHGSTSSDSHDGSAGSNEGSDGSDLQEWINYYPSANPWPGSVIPSWPSETNWNWSEPLPDDGVDVGSLDPDKPLPIPPKTLHYFAAEHGFDVSARNGSVEPGHCHHRFCVHIMFDSDYGSMSDFDAFVMDRYESSMRIGSEELKDGGPVPMILGQQLEATWDRPGVGGYADMFNSSGSLDIDSSNDSTQSTTWTLYPLDNDVSSTQLDLTLSLKQLYALLPDYNVSHPGGEGPFYWFDISDQVVLRVIAQVLPESSGSVGILPIVVNFTGSELVDVNFTSDLLFNDLSNSTNEMLVKMSLRRHRYGPQMPWSLTQASEECSRCEKIDADPLQRCVGAKMGDVQVVLRELLQQHNEDAFFNITSLAEMCFAEIRRGEWISSVHSGSSSDSASGSNDMSGSSESGTSKSGSSKSGLSESGSSVSGSRAASAGSSASRYESHDMSRSSGSGSPDSGSRATTVGSTSTGPSSTSGSAQSSPMPGSPTSWTPPSRRRLSSSSTSSGSGVLTGQGSNTLSPPTGSSGSGTLQTGSGRFDGPAVGSGSSNEEMTPMAWLRRIESFLRCWLETQCPIVGGDSKGDGLVTVLGGDRAIARLRFNQPLYKFYLLLGLEGHNDTTTQVLTSDMMESEIEDSLKWLAFPDSDRLDLDVRVSKTNNLDLIAEIQAENEHRLEVFLEAKSWSSSHSGFSAGSSEDGSESNSISTDRSPTGGSGSAGSRGGSWNVNSTDEPSAPPQLPTLLPVPDPVFTIEIEMMQRTTSPRVLNVFTLQPVEWEFIPQELRFDVQPLDVRKYSYVPPEPYVNLEWRESSEWMPLGSDSCDECRFAYFECLIDSNCAFGMRKYLWFVLQPDRLNLQPQWTHADGDLLVREINITGILLDARPFFPAEGHENMMRLLGCLATRDPICDINKPNDEQDPHYQQQISSPITQFQLQPATIDINFDEGEEVIITIPTTRAMFSYCCDDGNASTLIQFLSAVVFHDNVNIEAVTSAHPSSVSGRLRTTYHLILREYYGGLPFLVGKDAQLPIDYSPWTMGMETTTKLHEASNVTYSRMIGWLSLFWNYWDGEHDNNNNSGHNGTGTDQPSINGTGTNLIIGKNDTSNESTNSSTPGDPTAVCEACSEKLSNCLASIDCTTAITSALQSDLAPTKLLDANSTWLANGMYSSVWTQTIVQWTSTLAPTTLALITDFVECLSVMKCAVGYSSGFPNTTISTAFISLPTTVQLVKVMILKASSLEGSFGITYNGYQQSSSTVGDLCSSISSMKTLDGNAIMCTWFWDEGLPTLQLSGTWSTMNNLIVQGDITTKSIGIQSAAFQSFAPALPNWDFLRRWFSVPVPSGGPVAAVDACSQCIPALAECLKDVNCGSVVRANLSPGLQAASPQWSWEYNGNTFVDTLDVSPTIQSAWNVMVALDSQLKFSAAMQCFVQTDACDISYVNADVEPPSTAHVPTKLRYAPPAVRLRLFSNSVVDAIVNGVGTTYIDDQNGDESAFRSFLSRVIDPRVAYSVSFALNKNPPYEHQYNITFPGIFGDPPVQFIAHDGDNGSPTVNLTNPRVWMESYNQFPEYKKLLDLLSLALPTGSLPLIPITKTRSPNFQLGCDTCVPSLQACYDDVQCQYALLIQLMPALESRLGTGISLGDPIAVNMSWVLFQFVLPTIANVTSKQLLMGVLECSGTKLICETAVNCSTCLNKSAKLATTAGTSSMTIHEATLDLRVPYLTTMTVYYRENSFPFVERDGDVSAFANFLQNTVLAGTDAAVEGTVNPDVASNTVGYHFVMHHYYDTAMPIVQWNAPDATSVNTSTSTAPSAEFRYSSHLAFIPWFQWLTMPPAAVK